MTYAAFRKQDALILNALRNDYSGLQSKGRSLNQILMSVNNFRAQRGLHAYSHDGLNAKLKTLTRFHKGDNIQDVGLKRDLWEFYIHEGSIHDDGLHDDVTSFIISSDNFFKQNEKINTDITGLSGNYFAYKKAIRDPDALCIKYLFNLKESDLAPNLLRVKETHVNKSFKPAHAHIIREMWSGMLIRRAQANYFGLVREDILGTPHAYTMHSTQNDTDGHRIVQLFGESIEIVENWGKISTLQSRVVFELAPDEVSEDELLNDCDLMFVDKLRETRPDIVNYIWRFT